MWIMGEDPVEDFSDEESPLEEHSATPVNVSLNSVLGLDNPKR